MIKVFNLVSDETQYFEDGVGPEWAVACAYCEESHLLSALLAASYDHVFDDFFKTPPVTRGKHGLACGDFACYLGETP